MKQVDKGQIIDLLRRNMPHLRREFGVRRIGVFGSYLNDKQTDESDVDIVAEFERPIGFRFVDFSEHLEKLLGRRADILTPAGVSGIRNHEIAESIRNSIIYV